MSQSENIAKLAEALAKAQGKMKAAAKGTKNNFYGSQYADLPAVWNVCRDALSENGLSVVQTTKVERKGEIPVLLMETTLLHTSGEWIKGEYPIEPVKHDPQGYGSAFTYARRYALMAMVGVVADDEDDDGNAASGKEDERRPKQEAKPKSKTEQAKDANDAHDAKSVRLAKEFAISCLQRLEEGFKDIHEFDAWHKPNLGSIARLRAYDEVAHKQIVEMIGDVLDRLNPVGR